MSNTELTYEDFGIGKTTPADDKPNIPNNKAGYMLSQMGGKGTKKKRRTMKRKSKKAKKAKKSRKVKRSSRKSKKAKKSRKVKRSSRKSKKAKKSRNVKRSSRKSNKAKKSRKVKRSSRKSKKSRKIRGGLALFGSKKDKEEALKKTKEMLKLESKQKQCTSDNCRKHYQEKIDNLRKV